jgi:hypothetical protein
MKTNVGIQRRSTSGLPIFDSLANAVSTVDNLLIGKLTGPDGTSLSFKSLNTKSAVAVNGAGALQGVRLGTAQKLIANFSGDLIAASQLCWSGTGNIELNSNSAIGWRMPLLIMSKANGSTEIGFSSSNSGTFGNLCNSAIAKKMPNGYLSLILFGNGVSIGSVASSTCYVRPSSTTTQYEIYSLL